MEAAWLLQETVELRYEFDASKLTRILKKKYGPARKDINKKKISNKLNRLHCMHLITRKRVKREIVTRDGKVCNRGYKYLYWTNKQGSTYARYLISARTRKIQQMQEASRSRNDQNILILTMFAINLQQHTRIMQLLGQNTKSPEPKILGKSLPDWISLLPKAEKALNMRDRIISIQSKIIEYQKLESSSFSESIKGKSSPLTSIMPRLQAENPELSNNLSSPSDSNVASMEKKVASDLLKRTIPIIATEQPSISVSLDELLHLPRDNSGQVLLINILYLCWWRTFFYERIQQIGKT